MLLNLDPKKKLIMIKNEKNYGFAKGNNIGMKFALNTLNPEYILLLNNDTAVEPDFLTKKIKSKFQECLMNQGYPESKLDYLRFLKQKKIPLKQ